MLFKILDSESFKSAQYSYYYLIITINNTVPSFVGFAFEFDQETTKFLSLKTIYFLNTVKMRKESICLKNAL